MEHKNPTKNSIDRNIDSYSFSVPKKRLKTWNIKIPQRTPSTGISTVTVSVCQKETKDMEHKNPTKNSIDSYSFSVPKKRLKTWNIKIPERTPSTGISTVTVSVCPKRD